MNHLVVFARWPEPGRVKTRLIPALTPEEACEVHRELVAEALLAAAAVSVGARVLAWADAPADVPPLPGFTLRDQGPGDLGARLERAFTELMAKPGDRVVVMGTDCPDLRASQLEAAFEELVTHDLVLGPARDGGYYLIGLRRPIPRLFHGIPWGTHRVLAQTLERAGGLRVSQLEALDDVDTPADLARWRASGAGQADASKPGTGA